MTVTDEDVDDMVSVLKMSGAYFDCHLDMLRQFVRRKMEEGKVPDFEIQKWVKREETGGDK